MIKKDESAIQYLIVGDGPSRGTLEEQARIAGLENIVRFLGEIKDVGEILLSADIFVLPSCEIEGLSMSVLEAMAYGKPVIATAIGGIPEAVDDGVTGILVPPRDSTALAGALRVLLHDRAKRESMGGAGACRFALDFSAEKFLHEIDSLYNECLTKTL